MSIDRPITWFAQYEAYLEVASSLNCDITLLGDFNIDLVKPSNENVNKQWNELIQLYGFNQIITESTQVTNKSNTLVDHVNLCE